MSRYVLVPLVLSLSAGLALATCPTVSTPVVRVRSYTPSYSLSSYSVTPYVAPVKLVTPYVPEVKVVLTPVAVYAPYLVPVPAYGASYVPPPAAPAAAPPVKTMPSATPGTPASAPLNDGSMALVLAELRKMSARMDSISNRMDALEGRPPTPALPKIKVPGVKELPPPTVEKGTLTALAIVQAKCAACHEAKTATTKGGGLVLLEGTALAKLTDRQARKVLTQAYSGKMPPKTSGIAALTDEEVSVLVTHLDK